MESKDDAGRTVLCCPICVEVLDRSDRMFMACPCAYKVCSFCVRRIETEFDKRCPGCRRTYDEKNFRFDDVDPLTVSLKQREKSASDISSGNNPASAASSATSKSASGSGTAATAPTNLKALANARVVQKNLVFILGIAPSIAARETLGAWEYFGQYGKIEKVTVKKPASSQSSSELAASAYVTYAKASDAHAAILAVDGLSFKGHTIKACLGTTKYCNMFLRNANAPTPSAPTCTR